MKPKYKILISLAAVLLWMGIIFWFSSQNGEQSGAMSREVTDWVLSLFGLAPDSPIADILHLCIRKGAHFTEYLILSVLLMNLFRRLERPAGSCFVFAILISFLYAVSDEWHQYFIGGRYMNALDVGIDTCGAVLGSTLYYLISRIGGKKTWIRSINVSPEDATKS